MRKPDKKEHINLLFSAFLVIAFIICANFFAKSIESMSVMAGRLVVAGVYIVFGVLLFFATRIGEGKPVKRFSPFTLCVMVVPSFFIILASLFDGMPLHGAFMPGSVYGLSVVASLASVAFGYGILYTFFSGFELEEEDEYDDDDEDYEDDDDDDVVYSETDADMTETEDYEEEEEEEEEDESDEEAVMRRYERLGL